MVHRCMFVEWEKSDGPNWISYVSFGLPIDRPTTTIVDYKMGQIHQSRMTRMPSDEAKVASECRRALLVRRPVCGGVRSMVRARQCIGVWSTDPPILCRSRLGGLALSLAKGGRNVIVLFNVTAIAAGPRAGSSFPTVRDSQRLSIGNPTHWQEALRATIVPLCITH